jgi:hypothetical protein
MPVARGRLSRKCGASSAPRRSKKSSSSSGPPGVLPGALLSLSVGAARYLSVAGAGRPGSWRCGVRPLLGEISQLAVTGLGNLSPSCHRWRRISRWDVISSRGFHRISNFVSPRPRPVDFGARKSCGSVVPREAAMRCCWKLDGEGRLAKQDVALAAAGLGVSARAAALLLPGSRPYLGVSSSRARPSSEAVVRCQRSGVQPRVWMATM